MKNAYVAHNLEPVCTIYMYLKKKFSVSFKTKNLRSYVLRFFATMFYILSKMFFYVEV